MIWKDPSAPHVAANVKGFNFQFNADSGFGALNATRTLTLQNIPYQVVDFADASGQYVRLTFQSQYPNPDGNLGFTEVQLFEVPEPGALSVLAMGLPLLSRRRRPRAA